LFKLKSPIFAAFFEKRGFKYFGIITNTKCKIAFLFHTILISGSQN
ncbi:MAG: hypothetical protein ACI956_002536, partial [Nonlabens sp.]